ncbi:MAG: DUF2141 domain-containing protein [Bacteroidota bacterium]
MFIRLLFLLCIGQSLFAQDSQITVTITGLETKGQVLIGLYDSADDFLEDGKAVAGIVLDVNSESVSHTFTLPHGSYAVTAYHDVNSNDELDTGLFGVPKEPYGFSKNVFGNFGPPDFEDVKITLAAGAKEVTRLVLK